VWSRNGASIAYSVQIVPNPGQGAQDYGGDLYVADQTGAGARMVMRHSSAGEDYRFPSFSPDGHTLYFSHALPGVPARFEILSLDLETGQQSQLLDNGVDGEISVDGKRFVYVDVENNQQAINVVELPHGEPQRLVSPANGLIYFFGPRFSPDGSHVLFSASGDDITVPMARRFGSPYLPVSYSVRAPGGKRRAVPAGRGARLATDGPPWDMFVVDRPEHVLRLTEIYDDLPHGTWSPDGTVVLFIGVGGLQYVRADGAGGPVKLGEGILHAQIDWRWTETP
jgi:Tol biopolymer transport system component